MSTGMVNGMSMGQGNVPFATGTSDDGDEEEKKSTTTPAPTTAAATTAAATTAAPTTAAATTAAATTVAGTTKESEDKEKDGEGKASNSSGANATPPVSGPEFRASPTAVHQLPSLAGSFRLPRPPPHPHWALGFCRGVSRYHAILPEKGWQQRGSSPSAGQAASLHWPSGPCPHAILLSHVQGFESSSRTTLHSSISEIFTDREA